MGCYLSRNATTNWTHQNCLAWDAYTASANAFQVIADHLASAPGTKSLIWFGGSFPNPFQREQPASYRTGTIRKASYQGLGRYVLGFYVSGDMHNKFHRIHVESTKPNVRLRYKPGCWALVSDPVNDQQLKIALESPFTAEGIQLQADAAIDASGQMALQLYINPQTITVNRNNQELSSSVDIIFGQKDAVGRYLRYTLSRTVLVESIHADFPHLAYDSRPDRLKNAKYKCPNCYT